MMPGSPQFTAFWPEQSQHTQTESQREEHNMNCQISSEGPLCQDTWIDLVWMRAKSHTVNLFVYLKGQLCIPGPQIFTACNRHSHSWCVYVSVCVSDIESVMVHATDSQANLWLWPARAHTYKVCLHARGVSACIWACVLLTSWIRMNNDYHIIKFCSLTDFWSIFPYFDHWLLQKDTTKKLFVSACACMSLRNVISWKKKPCCCKIGMMNVRTTNTPQAMETDTKKHPYVHITCTFC